MAKLVPGVNDLATLFPEVAKEANGWDPRTVSAGSSSTPRTWRCKHGHEWKARVFERTPPHNQGCPYCSGKRVLPGVNDLASLFPELAKQAVDWDPKQVKPGSEKKYLWQCAEGHRWVAKVCDRTTPAKRSGCPYCSGRKAVPGVNDLPTLFPEVAKEADGWDPTGVKPGSDKTLSWRCDLGHQWKAQVNSRTPPRSTGCPYCSGLKVVPGVTDLATLFPEVAAEADGWDPEKVLAGSARKVSWKCELGHTWSASVTSRTGKRKTGCPYCSGFAVLKGFNDLATVNPELAAQAVGWDPTTVTAGSDKTRKWRCSEGHTWSTKVSVRTKGKGCPDCAKPGFKPGLEGWFYLLERPGEQQLGVTNELEVRLGAHARNGWQEVEVTGPHPGEKVFEVEKALKKWLRLEVGLVPGKHENWFTTALEVRSLAELRQRSGVETDLF